ncbi:7TM diverse intracellular signaling domain-containing protein [Hymenobacter guriensis]|uniref:7TM-DISM receptor extracellular domain-containing protein n=1 Tax=Hymenobacter guriensis TaxID=2793065 RepID=A0ABS0L3V1_9BACT|nr:7TM diverse intracellular signaling domain-containing protein [Hymenobacter guriensis]MBG8554799.1 hypothetical protein [Hymenobacter guriensis]
MCLAGGLHAGAQPAAGKGKAADLTVRLEGMLPDKSYSWERIRTDSTLVFVPADSLRPTQARQFWLKSTVTNRSRYDQAGRLRVLPALDNTLFYFDADAQTWRTHRAGLAIATDSARLKGQMPLLLQGRTTTTVYVHVHLSQHATLPPSIHLGVSIEQEATARHTELFFGVAWAVSIAVLLLLLLTNLHGYARFPDRTTLYYICTQVGAALYITAFRNFFRVWFPAPVFSLMVLPSGISYGYSINNILMHLSVVLLLIGFGQMTRSYLETPTHLPRLDKVLRYALRGYIGFTVVVGMVNLSGFYLNYYSLLLDNLLVLGVITLLLYITFVAYRQRLPLARTYLLANVLPLLCIMAVAVYHVILGFDNEGKLLLPDLAVVSHALCFSAAISIRLQNLQRSLLAKEREASNLALDIRQQELRSREIALQNTQIQAAFQRMERQHQQDREQASQQLSEDRRQQQSTNQDLQQQLEANQRELASTSLYVQQKNALLAELKQQIGELGAQSPHGNQKELSGIKSILQTSLYLDEDWQRFKLHFEQVHPRFFEELQSKYPALTKHEQRLYCYFHINLSTKEIAVLLNIDPASVRRAKTRLYKKIGAADKGEEQPLAGPEMDEAQATD